MMFNTHMTCLSNQIKVLYQDRKQCSSQQKKNVNHNYNIECLNLVSVYTIDVTYEIPEWITQ